MSISLSEILATHGLVENVLKRTVTKEDKLKLAKRIQDWKVVGVTLGFVQEDLDLYDDAFETDELKKNNIIIQWTVKHRREATYLKLAQALFDGGLRDLLEDLCDILTEATTTSTESSVESDIPSIGEVVDSQQGDTSIIQSHTHSEEAVSNSNHQLVIHAAQNTETKGNALTTILTERDVVNLLHLLQCYSFKWNEIGLSLGFITPELNTISKMPLLLVGAPTSYLQELLSQWVQWPTASHSTRPTLESLCGALRSSLVGLGSLADQVKEMRQRAGPLHEQCQLGSDDVSNKIEQLESQFTNLHKCIREELMANETMNIEELLQSLTLLPIKLRSEYQRMISEKLPSLPREGSISELFLHLNPLFTFIDYHLLEYIIIVFGSNGLKLKMQSYACEVSSFMKTTTVQQLIDYWPCLVESNPNVSQVIAKINKDAKSYSLNELNNLRRKFCSYVRLSDVISAVVRVVNSNSFLVFWSLPSILAAHVIIIVNEIEQKFFGTENIELLFVGNVKVYPRLKLDVNKETLVVSMHLKGSVVSTIEEHDLISFASELRKQYELIISPTGLMGAPIKKLFKLAIIHRKLFLYCQPGDDFFRMTISGKVDDIINEKSPIELENIFKANKGEDQQIVLIEGAPSSGKSSLAIYVCQKWGKGELFEEFDLVILVQLGDPAVQKSQSISDLLPCRDVAVAHKLASKLVATKGHGVLWILDGWDELPPRARQDSIFRRLMPPKPSDVHHKFVPQTRKSQSPIIHTQHYSQGLLCESSFIITSRPISSGDLHLVVSSQIEVLGYSLEEQRQYFTECLEADTEALEDLLEKIQDNPIVRSSCYIPLNANLTLHYFKFKGHSLPNTECEIFATVIFICIKHHLEQEGKGHDLPATLKSLGDLLSSRAVGDHLKRLCELAYNGVMQHKVTFSPSDFPQGSSTLGLLHQIDSFLEGGKSVFYRFFHHSLLEVLAAMHIAMCLSDSEQASQFQRLFDQPHFVNVFRFYSALTQLKNPRIEKVVKKIASEGSNLQLVHIFRCSYEAQNPYICQFVIRYLDVDGTSLSPLDCLSIGYLISMSSIDVSTEANLGRCQIDDNGVKHLTKFMCGSGSPISHAHKTNPTMTMCSGWILDLSFNDIHEDGAASITKVLQNGSSVITSLNLMGNPIGGKGLQLLSEALITNTSLVKLDLCHCSLEISDENGLVVTEMLRRNKTLRRLNLSGNPDITDTGLSFIAKGLKRNNALKELKMSDVTAQGGKSLANAIATNSSTALVELDIDDLEITNDSGPAFVDMLQRSCALEEISFDFSPRLSDVGVSFIAEGLQKNTTVKSLSLADCNITSSGAKCIAEMLKVNNSLISLVISDNAIRDEGVSDLAEALKMNKTLMYLSLKHEITNSGDALLADTLLFNSSL